MKLAGEPDAGNLQVRFDEGEQWNRHLRHPLFSTLPSPRERSPFARLCLIHVRLLPILTPGFGTFPNRLFDFVQTFRPDEFG